MKLVLFFNGHYFDEEEIKVPSFKAMEDIFARTRAKELYVKKKAEEFKLRHFNNLLDRATGEGDYYEIFFYTQTNHL